MMKTDGRSSTHLKRIADIARVYGVRWNTASEWTRAPWFPKRTARGWPREAVNAAVEAYQKSRAQSGPASGDRAHKTALECKRLGVVIDREKETLEQARLETLRLKGALVTREEKVSDLVKIAQMLTRGLTTQGLLACAAFLSGLTQNLELFARGSGLRHRDSAPAGWD